MLLQGHFGIEKTRELVARECYVAGTLNTYPFLDGHELRLDPCHHQTAGAGRIYRWITGLDKYTYKLERAPA